MNLITLARDLGQKEAAVNFLQNRQILHAHRQCDNNHNMTLSLTDKEDRWRCNTRDCRQQKQLKNGTWIQETHLAYPTIIQFIYCWSQGYTSIKFCEKELGISH